MTFNLYSSPTHQWNGKDRKSTRLNSSHLVISYAVFCLKKNHVCQTGLSLVPPLLGATLAVEGLERACLVLAVHAVCVTVCVHCSQCCDWGPSVPHALDA